MVCNTKQNTDKHNPLPMVWGPQRSCVMHPLKQGTIGRIGSLDKRASRPRTHAKSMGQSMQVLPFERVASTAYK